VDCADRNVSKIAKKLKASQQIGVFRRLRKLIPAHAKLQLYKAAFLPHLTYCGTNWHLCRASDKREVERLTGRSPESSFQQLIRLLCRTSCWVWLNSPYWSTEGFRKLQSSCSRQKTNLQELFTLNANCYRRYSLRNSDFRETPRFNTRRVFSKILWPWSKLTKALRTEDLRLKSGEH